MKNQPYSQVALITGAAKRVGACIAKTLHRKKVRVVLHYRSSEQEVKNLADELNGIASNTAKILKADLLNMNDLNRVVPEAVEHWGRLDILINNASTFYQTIMGDVNEQQWNDLLGSNLKAPFFLSQAAMKYLKQYQGSIVNIVDIKAEKPAKYYSVYCIAKAALYMLTQSLAKDLGPDIRVNAVAPGAILKPESDLLDQRTYLCKLEKIPLQHIGSPSDIAKTVWFLIRHAPYITGQMIKVDGGRSLILHGDLD